MPVPGAKITHHVLVYRWRSLGFVRCRWEPPVREAGRRNGSMWRTGWCTCLVRGVRLLLLCREKQWPKPGPLKVGQELQRKREESEKRGKGKDGYYWE